MTPEHPGRPNGEGADPHPVDLPDLRLLGVHQPVILVADDEALIRNLVTLLLQHDGYFVLSAADGHEGLELSRKYPGAIDLLITDMEMPRMNGTDLCGHLMEERPGIKVLVMSGKDISEIISQNANMPFLPKPFNGETLKAKVRAILAAPVQPAVQLDHRSAEMIGGWGTWHQSCKKTTSPERAANAIGPWPPVPWPVASSETAEHPHRLPRRTV